MATSLVQLIQCCLLAFFYALVVLATTSSAITSVFSARQISPGCTPDFAGHPVSIIYGGSNGVEELGTTSDTSGANIVTQVMSARTPQFLVENAGLTSFLIRDETDQSLVAYATAIPRADAAIKLNSVDNTGADQRQFWVLSCDTCADPSFPVPPGGVFGTVCQIANSALGLCIQRTGVLGEPPVLAPCFDGEPNQKFNFLREFL
ncbi:hypothetical protein MVEN_00310500 [Mycena venus]|uniref:Uncharacterized protein n=1 Tax=Mycena venus TaxID=2733690 RepID=A0A8H6Z3E8_9AGAR|nr:hypothetical protein MVEN_00310500 [Mycena venus]